MHVETYSAFFTPRDKEPSLSSSEEKSLEFGWLERKLMRKQKYEEETEQVLCSSIPYIGLHHMYPPFCKGNYKLYIRGYSPLCSYLRTKESYDRWITRRL